MLLENLYVLLSNVIGQLLDFNALRVLWISIYRVHVLKDLGTNLGAVDKFTCCEITVEPPDKGHFGSKAFVLYSEVVLWWEV